MGPAAKKKTVSPFLAQTFDITFLEDIGLSPGEAQLYCVL